MTTYRKQWDRSHCQQARCTCHDDSAAPFYCNACGCGFGVSTIAQPTPTREAELIQALTDLFTHCAMVHSHWGDGDNTKEANAAIANARALLLNAQKGAQS